MYKITHKSKMNKLLNDKSKFKQLSGDWTKLHEGQWQRYLGKLNNKGYCDKKVYYYFYPAGSFPVRSYGRSKVHKIKEKSYIPLVRPILSSSNYYNYDLASYLYEILTSFIPTSHSTKDSLIFILIFIKNIQEITTQDTFMVSYDVFSLFTNILLNETIDVAV